MITHLSCVAGPSGRGRAGWPSRPAAGPRPPGRRGAGPRTPPPHPSARGALAEVTPAHRRASGGRGSPEPVAGGKWQVASGGSRTSPPACAPLPDGPPSRHGTPVGLPNGRPRTVYYFGGRAPGGRRDATGRRRGAREFPAPSAQPSASDTQPDPSRPTRQPSPPSAARRSTATAPRGAPRAALAPPTLTWRRCAARYGDASGAAGRLTGPPAQQAGGGGPRPPGRPRAGLGEHPLPRRYHQDQGVAVRPRLPVHLQRVGLQVEQPRLADTGAPRSAGASSGDRTPATYRPPPPPGAGPGGPGFPRA